MNQDEPVRTTVQLVRRGGSSDEHIEGKEKDEGIQQIIATSSLKVSGVKISWHVVGRTSE
jgi:hypothetical protein